MNVLESVRTALAEILSHKLRSILTLLGIVLGTTSLVVMVSVIGGAAVAVQKGLGDLGFDGVMFVTAQAPRERVERKKQGYSRGLRTADLETIESSRELIDEAAPVVSLKETARINGRALKVTIEGITPAYGEIRNRTAERGRYLVERDLETSAPVAVIGKKLKEDVFGSEEALGREILVRGVRFQVVGVLRSLGNRQVDDPEIRRDNTKLYVPITTLQKYFTGTQAVQAYAVKVRDPEKLVPGEKEAVALPRRSHRGISDFKVENIGEEILRPVEALRAG